MVYVKKFALVYDIYIYIITIIKERGIFIPVRAFIADFGPKGSDSVVPLAFC